MGRTLPLDDIEPEMLVAISDVLPTPFNRLVQIRPDEDDGGYQEEQRMSATLLGLVGHPIKVTAVDLPFLVGQVYMTVLSPQLKGREQVQPICLDTRRVRLVALSSHYAEWFPGAIPKPPTPKETPRGSVLRDSPSSNDEGAAPSSV